VRCLLQLPLEEQQGAITPYEALIEPMQELCDSSLGCDSGSIHVIHDAIQAPKTICSPLPIASYLNRMYCIMNCTVLITQLRIHMYSYDGYNYLIKFEVAVESYDTNHMYYYHEL